MKSAPFEEGEEVIVLKRLDMSRAAGRGRVKKMVGKVDVSLRMEGGGNRTVNIKYVKRVPVRDLVPTSTVVGMMPPGHGPAGADVVPGGAAYADRVREVVREARASQKGETVDPAAVMKKIRKEGGPHVGQEQMEALMTSMSEELGLTPIDGDVLGARLRLFLFSHVSLEDALKGGLGVPGNLEMTSPTSFKVLSHIEMDMRRTAAVRLDEARSEAVRREQFAGFCERVREATMSADQVTTTEVFGRLDKSAEEADDVDGRFRKKIAEALKELGFEARTVESGGKRTKVFVSSDPKGGTYQSGPVERVTRDQPTPEPGEIVEPVLEQPTAEGTPGDPPDRKELPSGWRAMAQTFLQSVSSREFVSLEELVFRSMGKIPHELNIQSRGSVSKLLLSLGLSSSSYGERKVFHHPESPPSQADMRDHFARLDEEMIRSLRIDVQDAPAWMSESQRTNLSFLEHSVLLLCEEGTHTRSGLFPGHKNADWQRRIISSLQARGLVSVHGTGFFTTYSGSRPAIEQALDRDFLLEMFWPREVAEESSRLEAGAPGHDDGVSSADSGIARPPSDLPGEEEHEDAPEEGDEGPPTIEQLAATMQEMYAALENHASQIRALKRRVKELEEGGKDG